MSLLVTVPALTCGSVFLRLAAAAICGGLIGVERAAHGRPAGLRTFSLVCLGSCLVMIVNEYLLHFYGTGDPARLGAQVISGMGFLGAGTIIVTGHKDITGLTTAASLWVTACIGITLGAGFIYAGILAFLLILVITALLQSLSRKIVENSPRFVLYLELSGEDGIRTLRDYIELHGVEIRSMERQDRKTLFSGDAALIVKMTLHDKRSHEAVIREIRSLDTVHYVEET